ncbi:hypothetical protein [Demequina activiva]|uniref:Uncharacterized protein n=1 Tax=Demequina activiva TaxID=1582364 RepID=A0A919Q0G7_9MICO|nr:hypothetical protein [Demequina activiva]GIG53842.1 hypothetical protein Dac01nite_05940 [Demequina activiva]
MARIAITAGAGLIALLLGIGVGWTAQQWQPSSGAADLGARTPVESVGS